MCVFVCVRACVRVCAGGVGEGVPHFVRISWQNWSEYVNYFHVDML